MRSHNKIIIIGLIGLLASGVPARADGQVGKPLPNLTDFALANHLPALPGRVVLVDFWATWCTPCRASFPAYNALQREFGERGLTIIGVSVDQDEDKYERFVQKLAPVFTTVCDSTQGFVTAVHPTAMPTCYVIDRHGVVQAMHSGFYGNTTVRELREEITKLLEEKP